MDSCLVWGTNENMRLEHEIERDPIQWGRGEYDGDTVGIDWLLYRLQMSSFYGGLGQRLGVNVFSYDYSGMES